MGLSVSNATVYETYAKVSYSATFSITWPTDSWNHKISYSGSICGISVSDNTGTVTITGLERGKSYSYTENNKITCTYSYDYKVYGTDANNKPTESTDTATKYITTDLGAITVYTHPGPFSMGAVSAQTNPNSTNSIIATVLTADKINNQWIPHFE